MKPALLEQHTASDKKIEKLDVAAISTKGLQTREATDAAKVAEYAEIYKAGGAMPPIVVFLEESEAKGIDDLLWLGDGHHRLAAARKANLEEIEAIVKKGDKRAALWYAAAANAQHGLPRSNEDKRRAVALILADEEWRQLSDAQLAEHVSVSDRLVAKVRKEIGAASTTRKGKDGKVRAKPVDRATRTAARADIGLLYTQALGCLVALDPKLHPDKRMILAALYAVGPQGADRERIRSITGKAPDVHLAGLAKKDLLTGWPDKPCVIATAKRKQIHELMSRPDDDPGKPKRATKPEKVASDHTAEADAADWKDFLERTDRLLAHWDLVPQLAGIDPAPYTARILAALEAWPATPDYPVSRKHLADHTGLNLRAIDELLPALRPVLQETPSTNEFYISEEFADALQAVIDPEKATKSEGGIAVAEIIARLRIALASAGITGSAYAMKHKLPYLALTKLLATGISSDDTYGPIYDHALTLPDTSAAPPAGPEEITDPEQPKTSPEVPAAKPGEWQLGKPGELHDQDKNRPLELRRVDAQRDLIAHELGNGKPKWSGTDNDLFLLARITGVPSAPTAWIDATRATARTDFIGALAREVADRVRSGEAANNRKWPSIRELCALWSLDYASIEIRAERAVPA
jgi:hypothetical protein